MSSAFLEAARGGTPDHTPIWVMRQAGRYLPEYRKIRADIDFRSLTQHPELAAEVTLQPVRRFGMDAAILFSDIMTPLEGMGVPVEFKGGPVLPEPIRTAEDVARVTPLEPEEGVPYVLETVGRCVEALDADTPLIGFCGAPFTLLCYMVEGQGSKGFVRARSFMFAEPDAARDLLFRLADGMAAYLTAQAEAGARALMIFDSWVGLLSGSQFEALERPALERMIEKLRPLDVPLIYFPNQAHHLHPAVEGLDVDVIQVDWRRPLSDADRDLAGRYVLQGNLDPACLFAPAATLDEAVDRVLKQGRSVKRGHIFNLGHGIDRYTDPDQLARVVDRVHAAPTSVES